MSQKLWRIRSSNNIHLGGLVRDVAFLFFTIKWHSWRRNHSHYEKQANERGTTNLHLNWLILFSAIKMLSSSAISQLKYQRLNKYGPPTAQLPYCRVWFWKKVGLKVDSLLLQVQWRSVSHIFFGSKSDGY